MENQTGVWALLRQKLSSRKLWAAILTAGVSLAAVFLGDSLTPEIVSALKCAAAAAIAYIFGESTVDAAREKKGD